MSNMANIWAGWGVRFEESCAADTMPASDDTLTYTPNIFAYLGYALGHVPGHLSERYISTYVEGPPCGACGRGWKLRGTEECSACGSSKPRHYAPKPRGSYNTARASV